MDFFSHFLAPKWKLTTLLLLWRFYFSENGAICRHAYLSFLLESNFVEPPEALTRKIFKHFWIWKNFLPNYLKTNVNTFFTRFTIAFDHTLIRFKKSSLAYISPFSMSCMDRFHDVPNDQFIVEEICKRNEERTKVGNRVFFTDIPVYLAQSIHYIILQQSEVLDTIQWYFQTTQHWWFYLRLNK